MNEIEQRIGHAFADPSLLTQALTHPSARNELAIACDNQRMEFLGDAALGLAAADYLYRRYPDEPEGRLTMLRSAATSTATLATLARALDLGPHMILGRGEEMSGGRTKENNLADLLEAVIGAVYLDGGQSAVQQLFARHFTADLDLQAGTVQASNPKGMLQEWSQGHGLPCPEYEVVQEEGPAHQRTFTVRVRIDDGRTAEAAGSTKRAAEAAAAEALLKIIAG